jgi:HipA-like protein
MNMKEAEVYVNKEPAGVLTKLSDKAYVLRYYNDYFINPNKKAISLTLPKTQQEYRSNFLFPFFFNMLSEGSNKELQCRLLRIDENDHFSLLLAIGNGDTIGAVTVKPLQPLK